MVVGWIFFDEAQSATNRCVALVSQSGSATALEEFAKELLWRPTSDALTTMFDSLVATIIQLRSPSSEGSVGQAGAKRLKTSENCKAKPA